MNHAQHRTDLMPTAETARPRRRSAPAAIARGILLLFVASSGFPGEVARAQPGGLLKDVGFDQHLDAQIPLTLAFRDGAGREVRLADYFGKRPVILVMGYKNCPMLCSTVLAELTRSLRPLDASIGKDFDLVYVSINPKESPEQADGQRRVYLKRYNRRGSEGGWHALTGDEATIGQLARSIGFRYAYNPRTGVYAHAAGFVLLTPAGRISRYFYGVEYPANEIKPALARAAESKISSPTDRVVLFCYDYDPDSGRYTLNIMRAIKILGVSTALALGSYVFFSVRRDRRMMARATGRAFPELPPGPAIP